MRGLGWLRALDRKLIRDLVAMRGQAIAIALVMGAGVAMFVSYLSNFESLRATQQAYYDAQRFAEVFASLKRAPARLEARIRDLPGVARVETRVVADVTLDVPGLAEPASGRLVSVPARGRPALNDVFLRRGRWIDAGRPDEVIASESFVDAHGFHPGDRVAAIVNGRRRELTIVGVALSPEYIYSIRPGELIPDDRRFGVFWMERRALASAFDMEGGFNDVALALEPGVSADEVVRRLDALLAPYGGIGALPRAQQISHWMLDQELTQLQNFGFVIPVIFLGVAAFILNVAITRALALQRPQIAALKALGYANRELAWHFLKWALVIGLGGVGVGIVAGGWLGAAMIDLYNQYYRFPVLQYQLPARVVVGALAMSLAAAVAGALVAVRRAVAIPPAEAMRPEAPARYRPSTAERLLAGHRLTNATRMVLRNLERQPWRALASMVGIGFGGAILLVGFVFVDAMEVLIDTQFMVAERQDVSLAFVEPRSSRVLHEVAALPGVLRVERVRAVPARVRAGHRHRSVSILGVPADATLKRVVDAYGVARPLPPDGLVLSSTLARALDVSPGESVRVEILEGRRPVLDVPVASLVDDAMGLGAYMSIDALWRLLREDRTLTGASLLVDPAMVDTLNRRLKALPAVAGVSVKRAALQSFRDVMAQNLILMIGLNVVFAGIIAGGVVYNAARISLSERSRELASLRVLGFTRAEISLVLLGELALLTALSLPVGVGVGWGLATAIVSAVESEVFRLPLIITPQAVAWTALCIVGAAALSGMVVRRRLDHLDLVAVLKDRE